MTSIAKPMTLVVCLKCDRDLARIGAADCDGREWFKRLKALLEGKIEVVGVNCLGGCQCRVEAGQETGCCSVGLMGEGRFSYVLNQLDPLDDEKILQFIERYGARSDGLLTPKHDEDLGTDMRRHIATRLPPIK